MELPFDGLEEVFAADPDESDETDEAENQLAFVQMLETFLRVLYLIMWPLLAIA